jgi:HAD superfamily hydrolase (TIGR01490 family)
MAVLFLHTFILPMSRFARDSFMPVEKTLQVYQAPYIFFDLDDSLINKDASSLWIKWRARFDRWAIVEAIQALASLYRAYKKGKVSHWRLSTYYRTRTKGMSLADYQNHIDHFFRERGHLYIYPQAASLLFAYHRQGSKLVLITGQDEIMAKAYADALGLDFVIGNRFSTKDGKITGLTKPLCYGQGKVEMANNFAKEQGFDLSEAVFYSDSHADLPLLEAVKQPVVLNPNQPLAELAKQRGWPRVDWRKH